MTPKRPRDPNQLAKSIIDIATGEQREDAPDKPKTPPDAPSEKPIRRSEEGSAKR